MTVRDEPLFASEVLENLREANKTERERQEEFLAKLKDEFGRNSSGDIEGDKEARVKNRKGVEYPKVEVEGYGEVPMPDEPYTPNNIKTLRPKFTDSYKKQFKEWWISQGREWPEGKVNIHHIKPLSKGGDNSFENLVPLVQPDEHQPFTNWWRSYP